jgi:hypothetical protein
MVAIKMSADCKNIAVADTDFLKNVLHDSIGLNEVIFISFVSRKT